MIANSLTATCKDVLSELDDQIDDSIDPSEAIDSICYTMANLPHEYIGRSFAGEFRDKFRYWTLDEPDHDTPDSDIGYYGIYCESPELMHAPEELNIKSPTDAFDITEYAQRNEGKHWIFVPSRKRDGSDSVRKATPTDAKRAKVVAVNIIKRLFK